MKIVSYLNATVILFIALDEFLPIQSNSMMLYAQAVSSRYSFSNAGESQVAASGGIVAPVFTSGTFNFNGRSVPVFSLDFTAERINVVCTISAHAEAMLEDLVRFLEQGFGFRRPPREIKTFVSSALVVDFGDGFMKRFQDFTALLDAVRESICASGLQGDIDFQALRFAGTVEVAAGAKVGIHYGIEERAHRPPGTHWLFSQAPLTTEAHEMLLQKIEAIVRPTT